MSDQVLSGQIKENTVWYKNTYALLSIFLSVAGLFYTALYFSGKPSLSVKPNASEPQNLSDQFTLSTQKSIVTPDLSGQSTLPVQKSIIIPKSEQPKPVHEDVETANEDYAKGLNLYEQGKYNEAVDWYRKAAEQGHTQSQTLLGLIYSKGLGVKQSYKDAINWYRRAAEEGHAQAQAMLGVMYSKGQGVEQDYKEAINWYRKAADNGG